MEFWMKPDAIPGIEYLLDFFRSSDGTQAFPSR